MMMVKWTRNMMIDEMSIFLVLNNMLSIDIFVAILKRNKMFLPWMREQWREPAFNVRNMRVALVNATVWLLIPAQLVNIAHLSRPWSIGWVALSFLVRLSVRPSRCGDIRPNLHFFQYIQTYKPYTNPLPLKNQTVLSYTDPVPPSTNQYRPILTQHHQRLTSSAFNWPSTTKYQPLPIHTDPVS